MGTIADKLTYLTATKDNLKTKIEAQNVTVPSGATFREMTNMMWNVWNSVFATAKQVSNLFYGATNTPSYLPLIYAPNATTCGNFVRECNTITTMGGIIMPNVTTLNTSFYKAYYLTTISRLDISGATNIGSTAFGQCSRLEYIGFEGKVISSITLSGTDLNHDSLVTLINALDTTNTGTVTLGSTLIGRLSASELQQIIDKGWSYA